MNRLRCVIPLLLALCLLAACGKREEPVVPVPADEPAPVRVPRADMTLTLGTGPASSDAFAAGTAVAALWTDSVQGVTAEPQMTIGTFQNTQDLAASEVDAALVPEDADIPSGLAALAALWTDGETGQRCLLLVRADMDADLAYDLCASLYGAAAQLVQDEPLLSELTDPSFLCASLPVSLHDGAQRFYTEQGLL